MESSELVTPHYPWVKFEKEDKYFEIDLVDGKFSYSGNIEPNEGAKIFLAELGSIIAERMKSQSKKEDEIDG